MLWRHFTLNLMENILSNSDFTFEHFLDTVRHTLLSAHECPDALVAHFLSSYDSELRALYEGGIAPAAPVRWFYAEWHVFHGGGASVIER